MFARLFAESGLSLDRLRALVEVGAAGGIARAAGDDPVRQSQYSRQIKELEDFFQVSLVERYGKGVRLTSDGTELARISRFFLMGLSNFQRGCLAEGQTYRIGASPTAAYAMVVPVLASTPANRLLAHFAVEDVSEDTIERRLHELTLDFGVIGRSELSRPLQVKELGSWRLALWVPKSLCRTEKEARRQWREVPLAWAAGECAAFLPGHSGEVAPALSCATFLEAKLAVEAGNVAAILPEFLVPSNASGLLRLTLPELEQQRFKYCLAWNPRLLRLNRHAARRRDALSDMLAERLAAVMSPARTSPPLGKSGSQAHSGSLGREHP